jgi:hypothetical protein
MKYRSVAILSGISTRVADRLGPQMRANGVELAFVQLEESPSTAYFSRLLDQTIEMVSRASSQATEKVSIVLVSGFSDLGAVALERNMFFPAVRRLPINPEWRNNPNSTACIRDAVLHYVRNKAETQFVRGIKRNIRFVLPLTNTNSKSLATNYDDIYHMRSKGIARRVEREVVVLKRRKAVRIGGIDYEMCINDGRHPIRRRTQAARCDFNAAYRFGCPIEERLEFDVTCENGLKGKSFCQCDGMVTAIKAEATHLNMRINDDHCEG